MSKAVLISIRPEWVKKILAGEKTLELRKTKPKLETPFKVYIYCTNSGVSAGMWGEFVCDFCFLPTVGILYHLYGMYSVRIAAMWLFFGISIGIVKNPHREEDFIWRAFLEKEDSQ